ncbi:MAG: hypothetical protein ACLVAT_08570 [Lachnospiraceae bacterium]
MLLGEDMVGLIGKPGFDIFTSLCRILIVLSFVFNLVFCATTATIVSGAMAERTKFLSYCIYSGVISALIYPDRSTLDLGRRLACTAWLP